MLIEKEQLQREFTLSQEKISSLISTCTNTPAEFRENANHIGNPITLFPYIYHAALVKKYLTSPASILDWGAYLGQVSCLLQDEFNVTAQNPRKENDIEYWMQKLGIHNVQFGKLNAGPESTVDDDTLFDGIISSGVLEHTFEYGQTDLEALRILHANLKDDGYLFIWNLPTKHSLSETYARMRKKWKHPVLYELDDILVKLTTAGFEVVAIERNEIFFSQLARLFPIIPLEVMWRFDHFLATNLLLKRFAHHFTIVAQKVAGFPQNPSRSLYTVYP